MQDEVVTIHREMAAAVARIQPEAEYQGFLQQYGYDDAPGWSFEKASHMISQILR